MVDVLKSTLFAEFLLHAHPEKIPAAISRNKVYLLPESVLIRYTVSVYWASFKCPCLLYVKKGISVC
jgi:hypothetical protein